MDTYSINPASIIDEAVDLSMRLTSTDFPVSIFPTRIQRIISEVHECHNYPTDYIAAAILTAPSSRHWQHASCPNQARLGGKPYPVYSIDWTTGSKQEPSAQLCHETVS